MKAFHSKYFYTIYTSLFTYGLLGWIWSTGDPIFEFAFVYLFYWPILMLVLVDKDRSNRAIIKEMKRLKKHADSIK